MPPGSFHRKYGEIFVTLAVLGPHHIESENDPIARPTDLDLLSREFIFAVMRYVSDRLRLRLRESGEAASACVRAYRADG